METLTRRKALSSPRLPNDFTWVLEIYSVFPQGIATGYRIILKQHLVYSLGPSFDQGHWVPLPKHRPVLVKTLRHDSFVVIVIDLSFRTVSRELMENNNVC